MAYFITQSLKTEFICWSYCQYKCITMINVCKLFWIYLACLPLVTECRKLLFSSIISRYSFVLINATSSLLADTLTGTTVRAQLLQIETFSHTTNTTIRYFLTVEPRFNEPLFNEVLDITNDILCPGQSYSKMYGREPRYNEPRYNEFFDITNIIWKPKRKIYLDITNYNVNTRQKINAEQINSQQNL